MSSTLKAQDFVGENLSEVERRLIGAGIANARGEALTLLRLVVARIETGSAGTFGDMLETAIAEREAHRSLARIAGFKHFHGLAIQLDDEVYEPCVSSERLLDHALAWSEDLTGPIRILDLGTGAGNLLLGALKALPNATGVGIDINPAAITQATVNAVSHNLAARSAFIEGDAHSLPLGEFDLVVSTLPWVPTGKLNDLRPEVRLYDPPAALDGGRDGLDHFRRLATSLKGMMTERGCAFLQIGYERVADAHLLFAKAGFHEITVLRDAYSFPIGLMVHGYRTTSG